ncbi:MAG: hypothetical protein GY944_22395, partial [bacterium]|nr:hypothetical protein [bacterium]
MGAQFTAPFSVEEDGAAFQPEVIVWLELPSELIVGQAMLSPAEAGDALGRVLRTSIESPLAGAPRRPAKIRIADPMQRSSVEQAVDQDVPVTVAPTPELDALFEEMIAALPTDEQELSYLAGHGATPQLLADCFEAAARLFETAPWEGIEDDQVLRLDIPSLDVEGACVSVIGNLGEYCGVLVFPSEEGYEAFLEAAQEGVAAGYEQMLDLGTDWLALDFVRGADLPAQMRREASTHGWTVANAEAYPMPAHHLADASAEPPSAKETQLLTHCAATLCNFFSDHRHVFEGEISEGICEVYEDEAGTEVRVAYPYVDVAPGTLELGGAQGEHGAGETRPHHELHTLDERLSYELSKYAEEQFGPQWLAFLDHFDDPRATLQLVVPYSVHHYEVEGKPVREHFVDTRVRPLAPEERAWLDAQRSSWLSLWEVLHVEPGVGLGLRDLLSGETREIEEVGGSEALVL